MYRLVISERLKAYRKEKNISQSEFGGLLSVSAQAVSKWERGLSYPDINLLPRIADILECSVDELFGN